MGASLLKALRSSAQGEACVIGLSDQDQPQALEVRKREEQGCGETSGKEGDKNQMQNCQGTKIEKGQRGAGVYPRTREELVHKTPQSREAQGGGGAATAEKGFYMSLARPLLAAPGIFFHKVR